MGRVLIIDDCRTTVTVLQEALEAAGHEVLHLELAVRLPRLLRETPPDLVILDLNLGSLMLNGAVIGQHIRKLAAPELPIIIYSAAEQSKRQEIKAQLKSHYEIDKNTPIEVLCGLISRTINRSATPSGSARPARPACPQG